MFSNNRIFHPIYEECISGARALSGPIYEKFHHMDFLDLDLPGDIVVAKDGWLLMLVQTITPGYHEMFFFNPLTKEKVHLPHLKAFRVSMYFSSPPTLTDWCVVVGVAKQYSIRIHTIKCGDDDSSSSKFLVNGVPFLCSNCNPVFFEGLHYFLGHTAELLILDPKTCKFYSHEAPKSFQISTSRVEQYMFVSDGKLLAVFVEWDGMSVCVCQWNISKETWETLESLGDDKMLFVSRPQSFCTKATIKGTGNRVYFPRLVGSHCLYYSLTTRRLHTSTQWILLMETFLDQRNTELLHGWLHSS